MENPDLEKEKQYLYWLCRTPALGAVTISRLWKRFGTFESIYYIEEKQMTGEHLLDLKAAGRFQTHKAQLAACIREYESLEKRGLRFVTPLDSEYPKRLSCIHGAPMGLFVKGELPDEDRPAAAIIGARSCSPYGRQMAEYMGRFLGRHGVSVISGLACGIDSAGHRGALEGGGRTYGVLGCGINVCYPKENFLLYEAVASQGGLISEYMPGERPRPQNFPLRNRIISGLSDVILVMEAREKSGSLITVELGLDQGKEIFALPGRVTDPLSAGCNRLLQSGASLLRSPYDVMEYLGLKCDKMLTVHKNDHNTLAKNEKMVYSCLDLQPKCLEAIVIESGLSVSECMSILLELELEGYITQVSHQYYVTAGNGK